MKKSLKVEVKVNFQENILFSPVNVGRAYSKVRRDKAVTFNNY